MIENLSKVIGTGGVALVIFGYLDLYSYYSNFDISIGQYVHAKDIILAFSQINTYSIISIVVIFAFIYLSRVVVKNARSQDSINELFDNNYKKPIWLKISDQSYRLVNATLATVITISLSLCFLMQQGHNEWWLFLISLSSWTGFYNLYHLIKNYILNKSSAFDELHYGRFFSIIVPFTLVGTIYITNYVRYCKVISGEPKYFVSFSKGDNNISSTREQVYVGQTRDHLFLKYIPRGPYQVHDKSNISEITFYSNQD